MTHEVYRALADRREQQLSKGWRTAVEIEGYSDFVFFTKNGNPIMPGAVNHVSAERNRKEMDKLEKIRLIGWLTTSHTEFL